MRTTIITYLFLALCFSAFAQGQESNLTKEDLKELGIGVIVLKDRSVIKNIMLYEVNDFSIVYLKNESLHDLMMDKIARIEFPKSTMGRMKVEFPNFKAWLSYLID